MFSLRNCVFSFLSSFKPLAYYLMPFISKIVSAQRTLLRLGIKHFIFISNNQIMKNSKEFVHIWLFSKPIKASEKLKGRRRKSKLPLQYIFTLFQICAIFGSTKNFLHSFNRVKFFTFFLNIFILVFQAICNVSFCMLFPEISASKANAAMTTASFIHRWVLCARINNLQILSIRMAKLLKRLKVPSEDMKTKYLHILLFLSTLMYIPLLICSAITLRDQGFLTFTFNSHINNPIWQMGLITTFIVTFTLFLMVPLNIFALYYTAVCCNLQRMIVNLKESFTRPCKYDDFFENYLAIRRFIADMDKELSFLMFTSSFFNACTMYFGLTCWLHPNEYGKAFQIATIWFLVPASHLPFFTMILSACFVHEASSSMWDKGHELLRLGCAPSFSQLRILYVTEKELTLTVWKIVPIKRSFLVAAMGTIFTYCVLLDNLRWVGRRS